MTAERGKNLSRALTLLLLLVFALCALMTAAFGVRMYRSISGAADANYALRASISYVSGKIRALDETGFLTVSRIDGLDVLVLSETIEGDLYKTYIYVYDGQLYELFTDEFFAFDPAAGIALVEISRFTFELEENALNMTAMAISGETRSARTMFRAAKGGTP